MNYQPNMLAQGFRTGKTKTIGLIVSDISNLFYSRIARIIEDHAWEKGYSVLICSTEENSRKEQEQIRLLLNRKVDGLIISSSQDSARDLLISWWRAGLPHVMLDRTFPDMDVAGGFGG
jgi:LacI family transcriptional regulator